MALVGLRGLQESAEVTVLRRGEPWSGVLVRIHALCAVGLARGGERHVLLAGRVRDAFVAASIA